MQLTEYDKYNTLNNQVSGPKPKKEVKDKTNKYEALRQSGAETSVIGRPTSDVTKYDVGAIAGENTAEQRAYKQPWTEQLLNGTIKGAGLAGSTFASIFTTLPWGVGGALGSALGGKSGAESLSVIYDNEFSRMFDAGNKWLEENNPNYYSDAEKNASAFDSDNWWTMNFVADKVIKNAGFTVGAIYGGSQAAKGFQKLGKLMMGGKFIQEANAMNALIRGGMSSAEAMSKVATGVRALNTASSLGASVIAAAGEGGMEAKQVKDELKQTLINKYLATNGRNPDEEAMSEIERVSSAAGNTTFAANMAILTASDFLQFGKLFNKGFRQEVSRVGKIAGKAGEYTAVKPSIKSTIAKALGNVSKNSLTESAEEGSQMFTQVGSKEYYARKYDKKGLTDTNDIILSAIKGMEETFGTKEGLESMLLGAITGLGSHIVTESIPSMLSKQPSSYDLASTAAKKLNEIHSQSVISSKIKSHAAGASIEEDIEKLMSNSNPSVYDYKNLDHDRFKNTVQAYIEADRFDLLEDKLRNELEKDPDTFKNDWGTDTKKTPQEYVTKLIQEARNLRDRWEDIETRFPSASKDAKVALWDSMTNIVDRENRAKELENEIFATSGVHYSHLADKGEASSFLDKVGEAYDNGKVTVDINKAKDLVALVNEKKKLTAKYKELTTPEGQSRVDEIVTKAKKEIEPEVREEEKPNVAPISASEEVSQSITGTDTPKVDTSSPEENNEAIKPTSSLDEDKVKEVYSQLVNVAKQRVNSGESRDSIIKDLQEILNDEESDENTKEAVSRVISALEKGKKNEEPVEDMSNTEIDEVNSKVEDEVALQGRIDEAKKEINEMLASKKVTKQALLDVMKAELETPEEDTDIPVVEAIVKLLEDSIIKDKEKAEAAKLAKEEAERKKKEEEDAKPKVPEVLGTDPIDESELPEISDDKKVHLDIDQEMRAMSHTTLRSTADHYEAFEKDIYSVLRFQNFLHHPENNFSGLRLKVIVESNPIYKSLLNKKQKGFEGSGDGILTVVVDQEDNVLIADGTGKIIEVESLENSLSKYKDVDSDTGILTTTIVKNPTGKSSGFNTVSYNNFGRANGLGENSYKGKGEEPKEGTPLGDAWKAHKDELASIRTRILSGEITHLDITDKSNGVLNYAEAFKDDNETTIEEAFDINHNDPSIKFILSKISDINNPGYAKVGSFYGLKEEQLVRVGKPYLIYKGELYPIKSRTINYSEAKIVSQLLTLVGNRSFRKDIKGAQAALTAAKKYIFISPNEESASRQGDKRLFIKDDTIYFGERSSVLLADAVNSEELLEFLMSKYRQVEAKALSENPETSIISSVDIDKNKVNYSTKKITYRDSIFNRVKDSPALYVNMLPIAKNIKSPTTFYNGYLVYKPSIDITTTTSIVETKQEVEDKPLANLTMAQKLAMAKAKKGETTKSGKIEKLKRLASLRTSDKKEDIASMQEWFTNKFGEGFKVVKSLIDGNAFGQWTKAGVTIYEAAEYGTVYHEAFHKFTQEYLTPKERASLYDDVRRTEGKMSDEKAEEFAAEDYRNFMLSGQKAIKNKPRTNNIFRKIYNFLRTLLTGKTTLEQVYDRLASNKPLRAKKLNAQFNKLNKAIPGLTHTQTKYIVDSVNAHFFNILFENDLTPDEVIGEKGKKYVAQVYTRVKEEMYDTYLTVLTGLEEGIFSEEEARNIGEHYEFSLGIDENLEATGLNSLVIDAHKEYLSGLGIHLHPLVGREVEEEDEQDEGEELNSRDKAEWGNANEEDPIQETPPAIKLLIMSLNSVDEEGNPTMSPIAGPELVNFKETYNKLLSILAGTSQFDEMYYKLEDKLIQYPVFKQLLNRLGSPTSENISNEQFELQMQFRQTFSKFESKGTITLINPETGDYYQQDANAARLMNKIKEKWISNLRDEKRKYITKTNLGILTIDPTKEVDGKKIIDLSPRRFLHELGIDFTDYSNEELFDVAYNKYGVDLNDMKNIIAKELIRLHSKGEPINDLFDRKNDLVGRMNQLLEIEAEVSKEVVELSYMSAEGKRIYTITLNNYYSLIVNAINNSETIDELFTRYPHLNTVYTKNSIWLKNLFDKNGVKKTGSKLSMNTVSGMKMQNDNQSGTSATALEPADKAVQEINDLLLHGTTSLTRAADKSTEYAYGGIRFSTTKGESHIPVPIEVIEESGFNNDDVKAIFLGYFNDELARIRSFNIDGLGKNIQIYNTQAGNWSLFADILSPSTKELLNPMEEKDGKMVPTKDNMLHNDLATTPEITQKVKGDIIAFLEAYTSKTLKPTLSKLKIGEETDLGYSGISPKLVTKNQGKQRLDTIYKAFAVNHLINTIEQHKLLIGDPAFYKDKFKRISGGTGTKKTAATSSTVDSWLNSNTKRIDGKKSDGVIRAIVFGDNKVKSKYFDAYFNAIKEQVGEEKAQMLMDEAYASMDEGDAQGWITLDEYREFFIRAGEWTSDHEAQYQWEIKTERGEEVGENPGFFFMPIKAQHFGAQIYEGLYAPAFHKYSLAPIYHSLVKGRNMKDLLSQMRDKQVGYALFGSGSKVGTLLGDNGKLPAFYDENGIASIDSAPIQKINYEFLGIQLDIAAKQKEKVVFGTQFRKLLLSNLFGEEAIAPEFEKLKNEYTQIIDQLVNNEMTKVLKDLDITDNKNGTFTFNNGYQKLVDLLRETLADKDTADNMIDNLQVDDKGNLLYPIDSMVNRPKIEAMLFTIVNSKVIKQKMPGDGMVQLASSGFEAKGAREAGTSNHLAFYESKDGKTTAMEVEVPMMPQFEPLLSKYKTLDALNGAIANGKIEDKMLTMIGYRIPTQGLNSIDFMKIKRFLPSSNGNSIILPTEVVAKSGGDYDIDKLNVFRPNLIYDEKSDSVVYTTYLGDVTKASKQALQNRIVEISTEVLQHPKNFANLVMPNTTKTLTDAVADIRKAQGKGKVEKASATKELLFTHILEQFTYFLGGKAGVGIGAVHNTHHTLSQIARTTLRAEIPFKHNNKTITINKYGDEIAKDGIGGENINSIDLGAMYDQGGNLISDIISQFINAYVDVAKDPFYRDLNAGTEVAGVWFYLIRAGVDVKTIAYFMTQPIIVNYVNARKLNKSMVVATSKLKKGEREVSKGRESMITQTIEEIQESMKSAPDNMLDYLAGKIAKEAAKLDSIYNEMEAMYGSPKKKVNIDFSADNINEKLLSWISMDAKGEENDEYLSAQKAALKYFVEFEKHASDLTALMRGTNQDTTKLQNYGSILAKENINSAIANSEVIPSNAQSDILSKTIVGSFDKASSLKEMFKSLFLSTRNLNIKQKLDDILNEIAPKTSDFEKIYNTIQNDFIGYITQLHGIDSKGAPLANKLQTLFTGSNSLAKRLQKLNSNLELANNPLIKELVAQINADTKSIDNIKLYSRKMTAFESNILTGAFRELLESNDPKIVSFAEDLAYLGILQSGLHNSPITFTNLIPYEFYGRVVKNALDRVSSVDLVDFRNRFFIKNQTDNRIVPFINDENRFRLENRQFVRLWKKDGYTLLSNGQDIEITKLSSLFKSIVPHGFRQQDYGIVPTGIHLTPKKTKEEVENEVEDIDDSVTQDPLDNLSNSILDEDELRIFNENQKSFGDEAGSFQKNDEASTLEKSYVSKQLNRLKIKFGLEFNIIDDKNLRWAGKFENGVATINLAYAKKDTAFHEFGHPFISSIKKNNRALYQKLAKQLVGTDTLVRTAIKYPELTTDQQIEEAMVQLLGELASEMKIEEGLLATIKLLIKRIANSLGFNQIYVDSFSVNTTLSELARMLTNDDILDMESVFPVTSKVGAIKQKIQENRKIEERLVSLGLLRLTCKK